MISFSVMMRPIFWVGELFSRFLLSRSTFAGFSFIFHLQTSNSQRCPSKFLVSFVLNVIRGQSLPNLCSTKQQMGSFFQKQKIKSITKWVRRNHKVHNLYPYMLRHITYIITTPNAHRTPTFLCLLESSEKVNKSPLSCGSWERFGFEKLSQVEPSIYSNPFIQIWTRIGSSLVGSPFLPQTHPAVCSETGQLGIKSVISLLLFSEIIWVCISLAC